MSTGTQKEFAAWLGVSAPYVAKLKKQGKLVLSNGAVDFEKSKAHIQHHTGRGKTAAAEVNRDELIGVNQPIEPAAAEPSGMSKAELDRRLQAQKVKIAEQEARAAVFETDLREGRLLDAETVRRQDSELGVALRNRLLAIPSEQAIRLAALTTPAEVADVLRKAIKDALIEFLAACRVDP